MKFKMNSITNSVAAKKVIVRIKKMNSLIPAPNDRSQKSLELTKLLVRFNFLDFLG
jgi:hypothetical protein